MTNSKSSTALIFTSTCLSVAILCAGSARAQFAESTESYGGYGSSAIPAGAGSSGRADGRIAQWFGQYDQIRRQAQMSPQERQQADYFLSKVTAVFVPGQEKIAAKQLLSRMVGRYRQASMAMKQMPIIPQTEQLQRGYYQYFVTAGNLFIDYLKVQENLLAVNQSTGEPIATGLMQRKQALEELNQSIQALDGQTRHQFGIAPYRFR